MNKLISAIVYVFLISSTLAAPLTTKPDISNTLTQCLANVPAVGNGAGVGPICWATGALTSIAHVTSGTGVNTALAIATNAAGGFTTSPVANVNLANSTISGISLGSNLATLTYGTHLTNSAGASTYNGSAASTIATDATAANTASTIMARDGSGQVAATTFTGALAGNATTATSATTATNATNATNTVITDDTSTNATMYPTWVTTTTGSLPQKISSTKLSFNPSTGVLSSTSFTGAGTGLTGTGASFTAANVTTNANLTGAITSIGNAALLGSFSSANLSTALTDETGSGVAVFGTSPILSTVDARGTWTTGSSWTLPAHTLNGTVSGGGNQLNNIIIGTTTPLAGTFTTINGNTLTTGTGILTLGAGKTATINNTLTLTATDGSTLAVGTGGTLASAAYKATGTSGNTISLLDGINTWTNLQTLSSGINIAGGSFAAGTFYKSATNGQSIVGITGSVNDFAFLTPGGAGFFTVPTGSTDAAFTGRLFAGLTQTSAAQSGTVCFASGTTMLTYDATLGCLASSERYKDVIGGIDPEYALRIVNHLAPVFFTFKPEYNGGREGEFFGLVAEQVATIEERLISRDGEGKPRGVRYADGVTSANVAAIQAVDAKVEKIKADKAMVETATIADEIRSLRASNDNLKACNANWKCRIFGVN